MHKCSACFQNINLYKTNLYNHFTFQCTFHEYTKLWKQIASLYMPHGQTPGWNHHHFYFSSCDKVTPPHYWLLLLLLLRYRWWPKAKTTAAIVTSVRFRRRCASLYLVFRQTEEVNLKTLKFFCWITWTNVCRAVFVVHFIKVLIWFFAESYCKWSKRLKKILT